MTERQNSRGQGRRKIDNPKIPITVFIPSSAFTKEKEGTEDFIEDRHIFKENVLLDIDKVKSCVGAENKVNRMDISASCGEKVSVTFYVPKNNVSQHEKGTLEFDKDKTILRSQLYKYIRNKYI